ncbi:hypothetical protein SteCoe_16504 [Stentor coeruleus]|uniref:Uncharacterized protein n=1 Tax=Stentor coeruleus TaxID=5963 RepID=A0A1R2C168_9CILI|nr:hypothetical protein SteCoe_16504 [Stentor coeruleus]
MAKSRKCTSELGNEVTLLSAKNRDLEEKIFEVLCSLKQLKYKDKDVKFKESELESYLKDINKSDDEILSLRKKLQPYVLSLKALYKGINNNDDEKILKSLNVYKHNNLRLKIPYNSLSTADTNSIFEVSNINAKTSRNTMLKNPYENLKILTIEGNLYNNRQENIHSLTSRSETTMSKLFSAYRQSIPLKSHKKNLKPIVRNQAITSMINNKNKNKDKGNCIKKSGIMKGKIDEELKMLVLRFGKVLKFMENKRV